MVVPVYNGERHLRAALDSVLGQLESENEVELLVSDDGSTDGSQAIIEEYANRGQVIALKGPAGHNWIANSNAAVAAARGSLAAFLHQDDLWLPGRLQAVRQARDAIYRHRFFVAPSVFFGDDGTVVGRWGLPFAASQRYVPSSRFLTHLLVQNFIAMPAPVFSREDYLQAGGMDERLWFTADWDLWIRLAHRSKSVILNHSAATGFRLHANSQTSAGASDDMRIQTDLVRVRHLNLIESSPARDTVERAGRFSTEVNACLAELVARRLPSMAPLVKSFMHLGFKGAFLFFSSARLYERSASRVRAGLTTKQTKDSLGQ